MARTGAERSEAVDVVVLTVIPVELEAARRALRLDDATREKEANGTVYFRGTVHSELANRDYSIALTCIGGAGNTGAATATSSAIAKYHPRAVLLMGIAAGLRDKILIGEVVMSDRVVAYEPAALVRSAGGTKIQPRPEIDRAPHTMIQDVVSYRPDPAHLYDAFARAGGVVPTAPDGREDEFRAHVARTITTRQGTIASGEKLLRDPDKLLAVRREMHDKTEAGEMEAAGIVDACRRGFVPWLVIRGISDFGDELKDDRFHAFASCAAAAVLHDFLTHGLDLNIAPAPGPGDAQHARSPVVRNPFVFGRAIDRDEDFVGRDNEQRWLRDAIDKRQPVQLLGERLMGKTSLLRWVERNVVSKHPVIWFDPSRGVTPALMVQAIASALGKPEAAAALDRPGATAAQAGRVLDALVPLVLLVDDADSLCSRGQGFEDGFFEAVRTLVQDGRLIWVSASQRDLYHAFKIRGLTSRFLNDTLKIWVGPLARPAAAELARRGAAATVDRIVDTAGGFAYGLQWLGDFLCRRPGQIEHACDAFVNDAASIFQSWWSGLDVHKRQLLNRCLAGDVTVNGLDGESRQQLRGIADRGLIAEQDGRFLIQGQAWRSFVAHAD